LVEAPVFGAFSIEAYTSFCGLNKTMQGDKLIDQLRSVTSEALLGRKPAQFDLAMIRGHIQGKVVMVTGAAGSIGSELCEQIARLSPRALVGFDQAEIPLIHLESELGRKFPHIDFQCEVGSITRREDVDRAMQQYKPSIVFHGAAYKHVPMLERHPFAAIENNIFGTWQLARAAASHGVQYFVMISTDKAVRPASVMGASKRAAELIVRACQTESSTKFVTVRFGNVLGSSGSVVPIFKEQIASGGPVTVTHPEMRRYFMTAAEACQLVLQAFILGGGGETFILDMGEPIRILDLARKLIRLSGLQPDRDIGIEFTGIRPGEKLIEELSSPTEQLAPTSHSNVSRVVFSEPADLGRITETLTELQQTVSTRNQIRMIHLLKELVPEYTPDSALLTDPISMQENLLISEESEQDFRLEVRSR
jgi:FlaA1/EpsC-like NDP-sugar epimerase